MAGLWDGKRIRLEELHRFPNGPIELAGTLRWDILRLWAEIEHGLGLAALRFGKTVRSVGVDTWGVDSVILAKSNEVLCPPFHYRDARTDGIMDEAFKRVPRADIFAATGLQFMQFNTLFQLLALKKNNPEILVAADCLLMIPDFFHWCLCGRKVVEFTNATTTQFFDPRTNGWSFMLLRKFGLPTRILPEVVPPGTRLGAMRGSVAGRTSLGRVDVIAPASHDTGSAVAAVPAGTSGPGAWAYLSSGTWSLMGVELPKATLSEPVLQFNLTNEGGVDGTYRLLKNIMGLWLVQRCKSAFAARGSRLNYDQLVKLAKSAAPLRALVDPDDATFLNPQNMAAAIQSFCRKTRQPVPASEGALIRCALDSLALKYQKVLERLEAVTGQHIEVIHIVGGGSRNELLNQLTANACNRPVLAGPVEATVLGNVLVQGRACGEIGSLAELRAIVEHSCKLKAFEPQAAQLDRWMEARSRFAALVQQTGPRIVRAMLKKSHREASQLKAKGSGLLASILILFSLMTPVFSPVGQAAAVRPNVLVILADQWRFEAFGHAGNPDVKTPNLDQLAAQSVRLVNCVSGLPVCSPMRASFLTGQRPLTHGVFLNDVPLDPNANTLAKVLRGAGYDTGYIGKWHVNGDGRSEYIPSERRQGFDYWKVLECTHEYNHSAYYATGPEKLMWQGYDAVAQAADARQYLEEHSRTGKPFFLVLAWGPPHDPYFTAPEKYLAMYEQEKLTLRPNVPPEARANTRRILAGYYAHCTALDDCIGGLRRTLAETGLEQKTLVLFSADHGDMLGSQGLYKKQKPYDESIRVPLLVHWPKGIGTKARRLEAPFNSEDFMPTILGLCKLPIPGGVEGLDFSGYIFGAGAPTKETVIRCVAPFGEWERRSGGKEFRGLRTIRYTYVRDLNGPWLLFDNQRDPFQTNNLVNVAGHAKLQSQLDTALSLKLKEQYDGFLSGDDYVSQRHYRVDANGTVPYTR